MGTESAEWYNTQILVGFTEKRGHAWHYKADLQGEEPNHYPKAIPVGDVHRRLFQWKAEKQPIYLMQNGPIKQIPNRVAVTRNDTDEVLGIFSDGYSVHQYDEWLIKNLANIIDDDISIGSAGLLKSGGVAWVSLEMPDNIEAVKGFQIRPHLLATTSHNGTISTTYKQVTTFVVCDNTYEMALGESDPEFRIRHSKYSSMRIQSARDALGIVHRMTESMVRHIRVLADTQVSEKHFEMVLNAVVPKPSPDSKMATTRADTKRDAIVGLYRTDARAAEWRGSALGVLQAFNTYNQHFAGTDKNRIERNMTNTLMGSTKVADRKVLQLLGV
jgi:phage/plasmid-like protein (TIGR03299 family)